MPLPVSPSILRIKMTNKRSAPQLHFPHINCNQCKCCNHPLTVPGNPTTPCPTTPCPTTPVRLLPARPLPCPATRPLPARPLPCPTTPCPSTPLHDLAGAHHDFSLAANARPPHPVAHPHYQAWLFRPYLAQHVTHHRCALPSLSSYPCPGIRLTLLLLSRPDLARSVNHPHCAWQRCPC